MTGNCDVQTGLVEKIRDERRYQDLKWGGEWTDDTWSVSDWIDFIDKYKMNAKVAAINGDTNEYVKQMIKVAALALAAAETATRKSYRDAKLTVR